MTYYKDITWCANKTCIKDCLRKLTPQIEQEAIEGNWWLSVADFDCEENETNDYLQYNRLG